MIEPITGSLGSDADQQPWAVTFSKHRPVSVSVDDGPVDARELARLRPYRFGHVVEPILDGDGGTAVLGRAHDGR